MKSAICSLKFIAVSTSYDLHSNKILWSSSSSSGNTLSTIHVQKENSMNLHDHPKFDSLGCPHAARTKRLHAGVESSVHFNLKGERSTKNDINDAQTMGIILNQHLHILDLTNIYINKYGFANIETKKTRWNPNEPHLLMVDCGKSLVRHWNIEAYRSRLKKAYNIYWKMSL